NRSEEHKRQRMTDAPRSGDADRVRERRGSRRERGDGGDVIGLQRVANTQKEPEEQERRHGYTDSLVALAAAPCARSHAYHSPSPSPCVADTWTTESRGFTRPADAMQRSTSKCTWGRRSILLRSIKSLARNMWGYLIGLSSPSVTDMTTTLPLSPRLKSAGQTRLPTFSIISNDPEGGSIFRRAAATMSASRWQPLPVLICTTRP